VEASEEPIWLANMPISPDYNTSHKTGEIIVYSENDPRKGNDFGGLGIEGPQGRCWPAASRLICISPVTLWASNQLRGRA
jgi:hypothetical protein